MTTTNENCLLNRACPQCKQDEEILLYTARWTSVKDDGTDDDAPSIDRLQFDSSLAFNPDDQAKCPLCSWIGAWAETEIQPEPSSYERVCDEIGLLPANEGDPLNRLLIAALDSHTAVEMLRDDLNCIGYMINAIERERLDNTGGPDEIG